ncbi:MAG: MBL fold metallo-hydrolase [Glaciecola sp.]
MRLHSIQGYIQNIHLVEYPYGCMLLDGCCKVDLPIICDYFEHSLKRPISDLKVIMVTHMHPDHAGCALALQAASGAKIYTGEFSTQWYKGIRGSIAHIVDMALALWVAGRLGKKRQNVWYPKTLTPTKMLPDNASVPEFTDWKVINTPGHTSQDISLVNTHAKYIYVADVLVQVKKKLVPPFPVYLPKEYKQTLHKLKKYEGYTLLMAHVSAISLEVSMIQNVIDISPNSPKTNWIAVKNKIARFRNKNA